MPDANPARDSQFLPSDTSCVAGGACVAVRRRWEVSMRTMKTVVASVTAVLIATSAFAQLKKSDIEKLNEAATVLTEIRNAPDSGIPDSIWSKAQCVIVIPDLKKAGFIVGGEHGSGVMSCKHANTWGPPIFMEMTKGSVGFQAGVQRADLLLVVMNQSGVE